MVGMHGTEAIYRGEDANTWNNNVIVIVFTFRQAQFQTGTVVCAWDIHVHQGSLVFFKLADCLELHCLEFYIYTLYACVQCSQYCKVYIS